MIDHEIGSAIRDKRTRADITQADLAHAASVDVSTVRRIESGGGCSVLTLGRLLDALGGRLRISWRPGK